MAIKKQYLKTKCKVTFSIDAKEANNVSLVGSFNNWSQEEVPLKKLKSGVFKGTVDLAKDTSYEFRYIVDGVYVNDAEADDYAWNDYAGAENCVITV